MGKKYLGKEKLFGEESKSGGGGSDAFGGGAMGGMGGDMSHSPNYGSDSGTAGRATLTMPKVAPLPTPKPKPKPKPKGPKAK
jgi:hypothetical protein